MSGDSSPTPRSREDPEIGPWGVPLTTRSTPPSYAPTPPSSPQPLAVPDPEPYALLRRVSGQVRGVGYVLIWLMVVVWGVAYVRALLGRERDLGNGTVAAVCLATLAWWALSIARRSQAWARRQLVREMAALSAETGVARVVEGVDPDPYPNATLTPRAEVVWGAILLVAPLIVLIVSAGRRPDVLWAAVVLSPLSFGAGIWLLRIAQARNRYAARQAQRAALSAAGHPLPTNGDYVPDPEPFPGGQLSASHLRFFQRLLIFVGGFAWGSVASSSMIGSESRLQRAALLVPLIFALAMRHLFVARRKEEWIFRERARAAILEAAKTRVGVVTSQLDPSWRAGTLVAPQSKIAALGLVVVAWFVAIPASGTKVMDTEWIAVTVVMSTLFPAALGVSYVWEKRRQLKASPGGAGATVWSGRGGSVPPASEAVDPEPYPGSKMSPGIARATAYVLLGALPVLWVAGANPVVGAPDSGLGVVNSMTICFLILAWWTLSTARRRESWARRELVRLLAARSAQDRVPYVVPAVDPDPYPASRLTISWQAWWGVALVGLPLVVGLAVAMGTTPANGAQVVAVLGGSVIFGGWLLRIAQTRRRYAVRQQQRSALGETPAATVSGLISVQTPASFVDRLPDPKPFPWLPGSSGFWRRTQRVLVAAVVLGWVEAASRTRVGQTGSLVLPAVAIGVGSAVALGLLVVARRREEHTFRRLSRGVIEEAARTGRSGVPISLDPSLGSGTFVSPRSKLAGLALAPLSIFCFGLLGGRGVVGSDVGVTVVSLAFVGVVALLVTYFWERRRLAAARRAAQAEALPPQSPGGSPTPPWPDPTPSSWPDPETSPWPDPGTSSRPGTDT